MHEENQTNNKPNMASKVKKAKKDITKNVVENVSSGAMQSHGVPKPIADYAANKVSNMVVNGKNNNSFRRNPMGNIPKMNNNGLRSAKTTNPSLNQNENIGKGSHPSPIPGLPGNSSGGQDQNNKDKSNGSQTVDNNKNKLGHATDGLSDNSSKNDLDNNSNKKSASNKLADGAKKILGFGPKPSKDAPQTVQLEYKFKVMAQVFKLITPLLPYIAIFAVTIVVAFTVMAQVMLIRDKINQTLTEVTTGIEKFINFTSGNGWKTEEETFYNTLQEKYKEVMTLPSDSGESLFLDIPLIASTINYSKVSDVGIYENQNEQNLGQEEDNAAQGVFGDFFASYMKTRQMRNFYYVANDKLGNYMSLVPGNRRLIGHMINYKITWSTVSIYEAITQWEEFFKFLAGAVKSDIEEALNIELSFMDLIPVSVGFKSIWGAVRMMREMRAYNSMQDGHDNYFEYHWRNIVYEWQELMYKCNEFWAGDDEYSDNEDDYTEEGFNLGKLFDVFPAPKITFYETTDMNKIYEYGHYLREVYIPGTFFSDLESFEPQRVERMVREIYQQRDYYIFLVGDLGRPNGMFGENCDDCTYNLSTINNGSSTISPGDNYSSISNIKVKLVAYYNKSKRGQTMVEGIPFEKYILGVVYAEVGDGYPEEGYKSAAVAARSFSLARPFAMGNIESCNLKKEGDGWILTLRGSTADQVYCDPDQGCSSDTSSVNNQDIYPGVDKGKKYKGPLSELSDQGAKIRAAVASTVGQVMVDANGNVTQASYLDNDQQTWRRRAEAGEKYTSIIPSHYSSKFGQTITIGQGNCTKSTSLECTGGASGEWSTWRQGDPRWGSISLGSSNVANIGCAATSIAIQLARSGVETTFGEVNPGTFVTAYKKAGGFVGGGNIVFSDVYKVAPNFKYAGRIQISGSKEAKIAKVKEYVDKGYYVILEVKKGNNSGQHWVAIISATSTNLTMVNPSSIGGTDVAQVYTSAGWSEFVYYEKK